MMKKHLTGIVALGLAGILLLLFPCYSMAAGPSGAEDSAGSSYPASFDLRSVDTDGDGVGDRCYVTPVRSQYPFGTCWGFAAIAAAETSILSTVLEDDPEAWKALNLSEKHLVYYAHVYLDDETSSQNGEGMHNTKYDTAEDIYAGGTTYLATNTFATGMGPVLESRGTDYEYRGKNGNIRKETGADGQEYDACYDIDDDWTLPEEERFQQDYILKESYLLPSPARISNDVFAMEQTYEYNQAGTDAIKDQLMQKRAVVIGFHADTSKPWETGNAGEYMDAATWAHYTWQPQNQNHAVTIVGWDDNYAVDNFLAEHRPPGPGAWLIKNSWGAGTNEFPDAGKQTWGIPVETSDGNGHTVTTGSGYFWLSYYDQSIANPEAMVFDVSWNSPELDDSFLDNVHRDQYDYLPATSIITQPRAEEVKSANIFTAAQDEHVIFLSYEFSNPDTTVRWQVYLLSPDYTSPEDGVLMAEGENTYKYGGFYMENLLPYLTVQKGQSYSIVLTQKLSDGSYAVTMPMGMGKDSVMNAVQNDLAAPQYAVSVKNKGESMVWADGKWTDYSDDAAIGVIYNNPNIMDTMQVLDPEFDNFPLKGFAIDKMSDRYVRLTGGETKLALRAGETKEISAEVFGNAMENLEQDDFYFSWAVPEDGGEVIGVAAEDGSAAAAVTAKAAGKAYLFLTAAGAGTLIIPVEVEE